MFGKFCASLFVVVALLLCTISTVSSQNQGLLLKWVDVKNVKLADLEPAGTETPLKAIIYVARTCHQGGVILGKYVDKRAMFYYTDNGTWFQTPSCQVR